MILVKVLCQSIILCVCLSVCLSVCFVLKGSAQLLGSPLKEKHPLVPGTTFYRYKDRKIELRQFLTFLDEVYCNNIAGLLKSMGLDYDATEWRLFIVSSSKSLKAVLLHNGNSFSSISIGHSVPMKVLTTA